MDAPIYIDRFLVYIEEAEQGIGGFYGDDHNLFVEETPIILPERGRFPDHGKGPLTSTGDSYNMSSYERTLVGIYRCEGR